MNLRCSNAVIVVVIYSSSSSVLLYYCGSSSIMCIPRLFLIFLTPLMNRSLLAAAVSKKAINEELEEVSSQSFHRSFL